MRVDDSNFRVSKHNVVTGTIRPIVALLLYPGSGLALQEYKQWWGGG